MNAPRRRFGWPPARASLEDAVVGCTVRWKYDGAYYTMVIVNIYDEHLFCPWPGRVFELDVNKPDLTGFLPESAEAHDELGITEVEVIAWP